MMSIEPREEILGDGEFGRVSRETREVLRKYHDAFRNHRPDDLVALVADDCVLENVDGSRHEGKAACLAVWQGIARATDKWFDHEEIFVAGNAIVTRWQLHWRDGENQSLGGINFMRVKNGQFVEAYGYAKR